MSITSLLGLLVLVSLLIVSHFLGKAFTQHRADYLMVFILSVLTVPSIAVTVLSPFTLVNTTSIAIIIVLISSTILLYLTKFHNFRNGSPRLFQNHKIGVSRTLEVTTFFSKFSQYIDGETAREGRRRVQYLVILGILGMLVVVALTAKIYQLIELYYRPILVDDALIYHAPRILMWAQNQSTGFFETWEERHNYMPKTGHYPLLVLFLYTKSMALFELPQWLGSLMLCIAAAKLGRSLGAPTYAQFMIALVVLGLPIIFVQSATLQTDLLCSGFMLVWLAFISEYLYSNKKSDLIIGVIAFAMAMGTKQLGIWYLAASIPYLLWVVYTKKMERQHLLYIALMHATSFFVIASPSYIDNFIHYGSFLSGHSFPRPDLDLKVLSTGFFRYMYWLFDPSGLPRSAANLFVSFRDFVFQPFLSLMHSSFPGHDFVQRGFIGTPHPVISWAGPLGVILFLFGLKSIFSPNAWRSGHAQLALSFFVVFGINLFFLHYTTARGRYHIFPFVLLVVLVCYDVCRGIEGNVKTYSRSAFFAFLLISIVTLISQVVSIRQQRDDGYKLTYTKTRLLKGQSETNVASFITKNSPIGVNVGILPSQNLLNIMEPFDKRYYLINPGSRKPLSHLELDEIYKKFGLDVLVVSGASFMRDTDSTQLTDVHFIEGYVVLTSATNRLNQ